MRARRRGEGAALAEKKFHPLSGYWISRAASDSRILENLTGIIA